MTTHYHAYDILGHRDPYRLIHYSVMLGDGPKLGFQEPGIGRPGLAVGPGLVEGTPTWHCPVFSKVIV